LRQGTSAALCRVAAPPGVPLAGRKPQGRETAPSRAEGG